MKTSGAGCVARSSFYIGKVGLVYVDCKVVNSMPNKTLYSKQKIIHTYNILSSLDILPSLKERDSVVIGNCLPRQVFRSLFPESMSRLLKYSVPHGHSVVLCSAL